jgi:ribose transport system substrate-binding protein
MTRKPAFLLLTAGSLITIGFLFVSFWRVFNFDLTVPPQAEPNASRYRLVLITRELDTPFWDKVKTGALRAAEENGASLEVWGSYGQNEDDFLKMMEIAIASKVDGIIVQGLGTDEFNRLATVKAAGNGIPVFTVANDVPMSESLRRTYIGSDHYEAGRLIGRQLLADMGERGTVVLMVSEREEDYQRKRLRGILDVLAPYADTIRTEIVAAGNTREKVVRTTNEVLNRVPDAHAFIAINAVNVGAMIQEINKRRRVEDSYIYSFDDSAEAHALLRQGKIDALIVQSPEQMGEISVRLMIRWLTREQFPLDYNGYFTDIRVLRAEDVP